MNHKKLLLVVGLIAAISMLLAACQPTEVVKTVVVEKNVTQEVQVTSVVKETEVVEVAKKAFTTPHPILGDVRVRQAIAYCTNKADLIKSVYPWLPEEDQGKLIMSTPFNNASWANYEGPEVNKYEFDAEKGKALLDEAGWKLGEGESVRTNANGDALSLKFTTTTAEFRKIWSAVFISQMSECGIQILPMYAPGSWWFGATTGLRHRDFELGAYAWVGESDPKGQTLYACNQIPLPENGWAGQNSMGWCNEKASNAINAANNSLVKEERKASYKEFEIEFANDLPSLPLFQRAEGNAANKDLTNFKPSATEYYSWNSYEWELPGKDTMVIALSQEPDTMYTLASSMAAQRTVAWMVYDQSYSQVNYDFQPSLMKVLSTVESGLSKQAVVEVKEGDPVVDSSGTPTDADGNLLTLKKGMKVRDESGNEVTFDTGTVKMKQLTVTYQWNEGMKWSDGEPIVKADFELAYNHDCDPKSGAVDYSICQSIQKVDFTSDTEFTVTYKPGYAAFLSFISPIGLYPSHQKLGGANEGKTLADIPAADWGALAEIAETPLSTGPYVLKIWEKGVKLELEANPFYFRGEPKIKKITILIVADTNQAVAQLLQGQVDVVGSETLGAGPEVQTVLDAQKEGKVQVLIEASATWEHIDFNLFVP